MNDDMNMTTYDDEVEQENVKDQLRDMLRDENERRADDARQQIEEQEEQDEQTEEAYSDFVDADKLHAEGYTEDEIERVRVEEEANYWGVIQDNIHASYEMINDGCGSPEDREILEQWQQEEEKFKQYQEERQQQEEQQESWFDSEQEEDQDEVEEVEA